MSGTGYVPVLAVDVGGTTIKAELSDRSGTAIAATSCPTPEAGAVVPAIATLGANLLKRRPAAAAGVVIPGVVDAEAGIGSYSSNIGWHNLPVAAPLAKVWGIPTLVGHDVTTAGRAEQLLGAGAGARDLAFVAIGTGVSAALMSGGRWLSGQGARQPGELGHIVVRPDATRCGCGRRGCLEAVASASAIACAYADATGQPVDGALAVFAAASHDRRARCVIGAALSALADGLADLTALFAPERIVIGGGLSEAGAALLDPLVALLAERIRVQPMPDVVAARFGRRAGLVGAALLAAGLIDGDTPMDHPR